MMTTPPPAWPLNYPPRVRATLDRLDAAGMNRRTSAPPLYRLFWRMGVSIAPPILSSFIANMVSLGACFALGWGVMMWALVWRTTGLGTGLMVAGAVLGGLGFGAFGALLLRMQRQRHGLPSWRELSRQGD